MPKNITAVILAGGKSSRIGTNKAFLKIGERTFIEIIIDKLAPLFGQILISAKSPSGYRRFATARGVKIITDRHPGRGSLVGIYSALKSARTGYIFVAACDMPLVTTGLIKRLVKYRRDYDVVIPRTANGLEPLCAVYSRKCLKHISGLLRRNNLKIIDFFPDVKVKQVRVSGRPVFNINTPADYRLVEQRNT
ncbi:MAG: molybdenum cofactor guanylyltransferase [Planctomycetes bacterium]|nr:molybdenum cofactor guanylyltransferase [Planctomycetota bacterium]